MAGYEPPSFSLGLDLGLDSEPQIAPDKHPTQTSAPHDEDFGPEVMDSDPESRPEPPRILKRLRREQISLPATTTQVDALAARRAAVFAVDLGITSAVLEGEHHV
ncbi:hypothetical protein SO802_014609 [Lithocarpus litseifolius]|uniref:Uncharacterized protein n=1 Tax=Lithocarpus litseifolius TaxID=425828 RepID=A0AAW2CRG0_9ROSI